MATTADIFHNNNNKNEVNRQEIQGAIAKSVELRALHASLIQNTSPVNLRVLSNSVSPSFSRPSSLLSSSQDYPVFTPSYEDDPLPGYQQIRLNNLTSSENFDGFRLDREDKDDPDFLSSKKVASLRRKTLSPNSFNGFQHNNPAFEDHKSVSSSNYADHITNLQSSPGPDIFRSSRRTTGLQEFKSFTTCNKCSKPTTTISNLAPVSDSHSSSLSQSKNKGQKFSWLFHRLKKKNKIERSPNRAESEDMSQMFKDYGIMSIESLKRELLEANENKLAALNEVAQMKSCLGELKYKLEYLEQYCEELKKALKETVQVKETQVSEWPRNLLPTRGESFNGVKENFMPVSHEVMVEGFLQIVSESRLSIKHFCKTLISQVEETDSNLIEKLNVLLEPYKLSLNSRYSKVVLYHLEALINQSLYQDFENCVFQKNGSPLVLDPQKDRKNQFSSFVALRNLSWNEVLRKGTKYYSEEFSKFCDQKMSFVISTLNWTRPWPEQLLQSFFVAAKCIWLLHLLAFSFNPPIPILRIEENRDFDSHYMEDIFGERQRSQSPIRVKIMVKPGFYVQDRILKSKVLCRYENVVP